MIERYVWRNGHFVSKATGKRMRTSNRICAPLVQSDIAAYKSVVSNKVIDGRAARREDLKRSGCREVDPSEGVKVCHTEKWAKRLNMPYEPPAPKAQ